MRVTVALLFAMLASGCGPRHDAEAPVTAPQATERSTAIDADARAPTTDATAPQGDAAPAPAEEIEAASFDDDELACRRSCSDGNAQCDTFKRHRRPGDDGFGAACAEPFERCLRACLDQPPR